MHVLHFSYSHVMSLSLNEFLMWISTAQTIGSGNLGLVDYEDPNE